VQIATIDEQYTFTFKDRDEAFEKIESLWLAKTPNFVTQEQSARKLEMPEYVEAPSQII